MDHDIDDVIDGRYRLVEVIGQGGHGVVYRAEDQARGTHVAIKCLRPDIAANPAFKARMRREARVMGELSGTSATQVFDFCEAPDGTLYIVMEFLRGSDLETMLRRMEKRSERLPLPRLVSLFRPIVDTLDAAHARGIIHRDLKPANIFVLHDEEGCPLSIRTSGPESIRAGGASSSRAGGPESIHAGSPESIRTSGPESVRAGGPDSSRADGSNSSRAGGPDSSRGAPATRRATGRGGVRLLDFGLVKVMQAEPLTREGAIPGSPSYIAPEVWKGRPHEIDHRIDVYSLGAVIFRTLSGRVPFQGPTRVDILIASTRGPRPSLHALRPDLPPEVDAWVAKALAVAPEDRFPDVRGLWNSLEPLLQQATDGGGIRPGERDPGDVV